MVRELITWKFSRIAGSASLPATAGSIPASSPGGTCGVIEMRTPWPSPSASSRSPYQLGTKSSVAGSACSSRMRLTYGSKYQGSTKRAPRAYAAAATRRTKGAELGSAMIQTIWPGWTLAPTPTTRSA